MLRNILFRVPFTLLNLRAPEGGEGGGNGGGDNPPPTEPPTPTGDTPESKLTSALGIINDLFSKIATFTSQAATATNERTKLQNQFEALTKTSEGLKTDLGNTQGLLEKANTAVIGLTTQRDDANKNVERLEKLCGLNGVDTKQAAPIPPEEGGAASEKTPAGKWEKYNDLKKEEAQGKVAAGTAMTYWSENKSDLEKLASKRSAS
jgi:chromosome segregation ATPase